MNENERVKDIIEKLEHRAQKNFEGGQMPEEPEFVDNCDALISMLSVIASQRGVYEGNWNNWDAFNQIFVNAMFPSLATKGDSSYHNCFQKYCHDLNPSGSFLIWFRGELRNMTMRNYSEEKRRTGIEATFEDLNAAIEMLGIRDEGGKVSKNSNKMTINTVEEGLPQGTRKKDSAYKSNVEDTEDIINRLVGDSLSVEMATHIISLQNRIAKGVNEKKRIAYDLLFHTRSMVHLVRRIGKSWENVHDRQVYLSLDGKLLQYTYRKMPIDIESMGSNHLKRNIDIRPDTQQSDAREELKTPFVLWVLVRYMKEIQNREDIEQTAIYKAEQGYMKRMHEFLKMKGVSLA